MTIRISLHADAEAEAMGTSEICPGIVSRTPGKGSMTGVPTHPVYYAKKELDNVAGQQPAVIQFYGATNGSVRNLVIVSGARASFNWLNQNLDNDGNPAWDTNRTAKPSGVLLISPSYVVTTRC